MFDHCASLQSIQLPENIETIPNYFCSYCYKLKSLTIPASTKTVLNYIIRNCSIMEEVIFMPSTPPTLNANSFAYSTACNKYYPYASYQSYMTATNYTSLAGNKYAHGTFTANTTLPTSTTGYSLTWYATKQDAINGTNPVTVASSDGMYFATCSAI